MEDTKKGELKLNWEQIDMEMQYPSSIVLEEYDDVVNSMINREVLLPYLNEIYSDLYQR